MKSLLWFVFFFSVSFIRFLFFFLVLTGGCQECFPERMVARQNRKIEKKKGLTIWFCFVVFTKEA
jgi:hypothetical protein